MKKLLTTTSLTIIALSSTAWGSQENAQQPNILLVVLDDIGFSDLQCYGSEIQTPHIDAIAQQGVRFTRFHTSSLSAPTRSMLLTGVDNHQNGQGTMPPAHCENQYMQAGYEGHLNSRVITIAELLQEQGYHTAMAGKWHLGARAGETPFYHGFDQCFSLVGGGASHFSYIIPLGDEDKPVTFYMEQDKKVTLPDDFFSSTYYADKMIGYIESAPQDKPFFGYLSFTAAHDPLQVVADWKDKYKGQYNEGYKVLIEARHQRMVQLGIIDESVPTNYKPYFERPDWENMPAADKKLEIRRMEIYAAMIAYADECLGRVIDQLKASGRYDNTIIILMADNGSNPHPMESYGPLTGIKLNNNFDNLGNRDSFISLGPNWAESCNTPFRYAKTMLGAGGQTCPLMIKGLGGKAGSIDRESLVHVTDIFPTLMERIGAQRPTKVKGVELAPLYGQSLLTSLRTGQPLRAQGEHLCFEMIGDKSVIHGDWKLLSMLHDGATWRLYNMRHDMAEQHDLAATKPEKVQELQKLWQDYAQEVGVIEGQGKEKDTLQRLGPDKFYEFNPANKLY